MEEGRYNFINPFPNLGGEGVDILYSGGDYTDFGSKAASNRNVKEYFYKLIDSYWQRSLKS